LAIGEKVGMGVVKRGTRLRVKVRRGGPETTGKRRGVFLKGDSSKKLGDTGLSKGAPLGRKRKKGKNDTVGHARKRKKNTRKGVWLTGVGQDVRVSSGTEKGTVCRGGVVWRMVNSPFPYPQRGR